jgi:hypothetical protein
MSTLVEAYGHRLTDLADHARKLLGSIIFFAVAIVAAGALRSLQLSALEVQESSLAGALPASWEPIEALYLRSFDLMAAYASEHSTPWSQAYLVISIGLVWINGNSPDGRKDNANMTASLERVGVLGRHLHDYNSDIRMIASAQRRGLSFEDLTKPELNALVRIFRFKLSADEEKTREETTKFALVVQKILEARPDILALNEESTELLRRFGQGEPWRELRTELLKRDVRAMGKVETTSPAFLRLEPLILGLPGPTIGAVRARLLEIAEKRERIRREAGVSLLFLEVHVSAEYLLLAGAITNLALAIALLVTVRATGSTWQRLRRISPGLSEEYGAVICDGLSSAGREGLRAAQGGLVLCPVVFAAILFIADTGNRWTLIATACLLLVTVGLAWSITTATARFPRLS